MTERVKIRQLETGVRTDQIWVEACRSSRFNVIMRSGRKQDHARAVMLRSPAPSVPR